ncbi:MAG: polysaccharide biosynthesis/export family protein [Kofleriaceae bacterium]
MSPRKPQPLRLLALTVALAVLASTGAACGDNPPVVYPTAPPTLNESQLTLGPGDKLELVIYFGQNESKATYTLDSSGEIAVRYIGTVKAAGKTAAQLKDEIQTKLADGYLRDPIVSVTVSEINSRRLSVLGQVSRSGTIKYVPGMTITDAIAQSGGFTPMARKNLVRVTRSIDGKTVTWELPVEKIGAGNRPTFWVMPGDIVFVPERVF